ncbi:MAG: TonB-dependent receptor [Deltaproteobacteria bacterium]
MKKYTALVLVAIFAATTAQAQTLDVAPEKEAEEQLQAFDTPPERAPRPAIEEMVITAQRKSESLQEVPIAVSAFNAEALEMQQIAQFSDLQFSAPNVSFTKTNFTGSNFSIRGVGSAAVAASGSPGVAFHINETPLPTLIFETEYFDLERVEILRGPQGTLYGQNATGGVVNVITAKPNMEEFGGDFEVDYGNFNSLKIRGAVNLPLGERFAIRVAGISLQRDGMTKNLYDGPEVNSDTVDGRDLWSIRATLAADLTDTTYVSFLWSRFKEDDNRARVTKQLCNATSTPQLGCDWRGSLETQRADLSYPQAFVGGMFAAYAGLTPWGATPDSQNPYSEEQNPGLQQRLNDDLRAVYTDLDPTYQADESTYLLTLAQELPEDLTLNVIGAYHKVSVNSRQDYNMDVGASFVPTDDNPVGILPVSGPANFDWTDENLEGAFGGKIFRWDQRVFSYDKSFLQTNTWYTEARISSAWESAFNFLAGVNYTNQRTRTGYNVLSNTLESVALDAAPISLPAGPIPPLPGLTGLYPSFYFNQTNPYIRNSFGIYGEGYYDITEELKFTGGIRYNRDKKDIRDRQTLLNSLQYGGGVNQMPNKICLIDTDPLTPLNQTDFDCAFAPEGGPVSYAPLGPVQPGAQGTVSCDPSDPDGPKDCLPGAPLPPYNFARSLKGSATDVTFDAWTGRAVLDYMTELPFTDETMTYVQWSRGYRPGGFNPAVDPALFTGVEDTFEQEIVNAFEVGMKNKILDLGLVANFAAFYYDYTGYQVSKIQNRTSINENIDANVWGLEIETMWAVPWVPGLLIDMNFSYLGTEIKNGERSVDPRDPAGERFNEPNSFLAKDSIFGQPCVLDETAYRSAYETGLLDQAANQNYYVHEEITFTESGLPTLVNCAAMSAVPGPDDTTIDLTKPSYAVEVEGNEMPNAPTLTFKVGGQYTFPVDALGIDVTPRSDFYIQSSMWGRIYNGPLDKIPSWHRWDAQVVFEDQEGRWFLRGYVKNILNSDNITGLYVSDAATAQFTNVFVIEPRLFGFAVGAHL